MAEMCNMDDNLNLMLTALVHDGKITQAQADSFVDVHDLLDEAGLMR